MTCKRGEADYYFSVYNHIWGWASWSNRWKNYALNLEGIDEVIKLNQFKTIFSDKELDKRLKIFDRVKNNKIDTWDYQWSFALYKNVQFSIIPKNNYILNLGFREDSTHTSGSNLYKNLKLEEKNVTMKHPDYIVQDINLYSIINSSKNIFERLISKVLKK